MGNRPDSGKNYGEGVGNFAHTLQGLLRRISEWIMWLGAGLLILATLMTVTDSFGRYFLNSPITGSIEIARLLLVGIAFAGMVYIASKDGNVKIDILTSHFPKVVQQALNYIMTFVSAATMAVVSWQLWLAALKAIRTDVASGALHIPYAPFKFAASIMAGLICLLLLVSLFKFLYQRR
jgi:TRAP-type C4-dicarboxylate transport system permease small subunit